MCKKYKNIWRMDISKYVCILCILSEARYAMVPSSKSFFMNKSTTDLIFVVIVFPSNNLILLASS